MQAIVIVANVAYDLRLDGNVDAPTSMRSVATMRARAFRRGGPVAPALKHQPSGHHRRMTLRIEPMTVDDWPSVRRIYTEGIATGDATLEREAPDWDHFDRSASPRLPAGRQATSIPTRTCAIVGWTALSAYSGRRVYTGVAWESVYVAEAARGTGVGRALLEALIPASEAAGFWTLLAGVLADNAASLALHERVGFVRVGVQHRLGQDATRSLARRRPARAAELDGRR